MGYKDSFSGFYEAITFIYPEESPSLFNKKYISLKIKIILLDSQ
jgi:hypothetical protein